VAGACVRSWRLLCQDQNPKLQSHSLSRITLCHSKNWWALDHDQCNSSLKSDGGKATTAVESDKSTPDQPVAGSMMIMAMMQGE
jgi:hypothetical protein